MAPKERRLAEALAMILEDRAIRRHLALHDPVVLDQARRALAESCSADRREPTPA